MAADLHRCCKNLWAAVLHNGVSDAFKIKTSKNKKQHNVILQARAWIESEARFFNSFLTLCDLVGIRARPIRDQLRVFIKGE